MLLPKALKTRAIKDPMALVADGIGGRYGASAQMLWHLGFLNPARQDKSSCGLGCSRNLPSAERSAANVMRGSS